MLGPKIITGRASETAHWTNSSVSWAPNRQRADESCDGLAASRYYNQRKILVVKCLVSTVQHVFWYLENFNKFCGAKWRWIEKWFYFVLIASCCWDLLIRLLSLCLYKIINCKSLWLCLYIKKKRLRLFYRS